MADKFGYTVTGLTNDVVYTFRLRRWTMRILAPNRRASVPPLTGMVYNSLTEMDEPILPAAPTGLKATGRHEKVELTWDDPDDASIDKYQYQYLQADNDGNFSDWGDVWR